MPLNQPPQCALAGTDDCEGYEIARYLDPISRDDRMMIPHCSRFPCPIMHLDEWLRSKVEEGRKSLWK